MELWFLWANNVRCLEKRYAKTFYNIEDATSALVIVKAKWEKLKTDSTSKDGVGEKAGVVRNAWSELS